MPENGSGRLDRIEASLERLTERFHEMVDHHNEEFKKLMTWQVLMQDKFERAAEEAARERKRLDALSEKTDKRIAELVSSIGELIQRLPLPDSKQR